ncbi:MAG: TRAP transporter large permease subunit [Deltaproteobacteria bacterium]|nr:TRAP transporter large permease subunit [Deltaproteobacteria bacterium]
MATDVCLRYVFDSPLTGVYEIIEFLMPVVTTFGLAYGELRKEHIAIDLLSSRFPQKTKAWVTPATHVLSTGILFLITWQSLVYADSVRRGGYVSQSLYLPEFPFVYFLAFGCGMFALAMLVTLRRQIVEAPNETRRWAWIGLFLGLALIVLFAGTPFFKEMSWQLTPIDTGFVSIGLLLVLTFSGMYLSVTMGLLGFLGLVYLTDLNPSLSILGSTPYSTVASYSFCVIPLFILMGTFCFHSGLSEEIYFAVHKILGHLRGGLAMATVAACACFAAVSGSGMATAATMGKVALPEMRKYHYDLRLATGSIAAGGSMGILIPPSTILILYGILTQQSIGKLFLAGFIPGVLEAVFYIIVIMILCRFKPLLGPKGPKTTLREKAVAFKGTWGIASLFLLVIGGIYTGIFTPSEAAGVGAFGAFVMTLLKRKLTWTIFTSSLYDTAKLASVLMYILIGAMIYGRFLAVSRLPFVVADYIAALEVNRYVILILIIILYLILGSIMDIFCMVVLTVPIIFPVITALGFDPIWFGVIVVRLFEMGAITPPIGINVFVLKGVAQGVVKDDVPLGVIFKGIVPFFIADLFHVGMLVAFPQVALFLPSLMH